MTIKNDDVTQSARKILCLSRTAMLVPPEVRKRTKIPPALGTTVQRSSWIDNVRVWEPLPSVRSADFPPYSEANGTGSFLTRKKRIFETWSIFYTSLLTSKLKSAKPRV